MTENLKKVRLNFVTSVHPDILPAIEKYGFDNLQHFLRQCARALLERYHKGEAIEWPIAFETRK